jgi:hypothetical protein
VIAPWIFELLRRERDWRAALPKIAEHLSELPEDRVRAGLELGAAFEHIEPDRYQAILAYQTAGPLRDNGRSRALALEIGWWQAEGRLAAVELQASGASEALIAAARSLIDDGKTDAARRLVQENPTAAKNTLVAAAGLLAEIEGRGADWKTFAAAAKKQKGRAAADTFVGAARLARSVGAKEWSRQLEAALEADPTHAVAAAMLMDLAVDSEDDKLVFDLMRVRCLGLDGYDYSEAVRWIATRLLLADPAHHAGLGRRLAKVAIERAYGAGLTEIPGHIALWTLLDTTAAQDGTRTDLLPLIMKGLDLGIPDFDRTWLAALGAAICHSAGNGETARAYAAIVAEHAPSHPIVRELLAEAEAEVDEDLSDSLELLEDDAQTPPVESLLPDDLELGHMWMGEALPRAATEVDDNPGFDPRFIDLSVRALDDLVETPPEPPAPAPAAAAAPKPAAAPVAKPVPPEPEAPKRNSTIDEEWDVDEELFPRRRRSTKISEVLEPILAQKADPPSAPLASSPAPTPPPATNPAPAAAAVTKIVNAATLAAQKPAPTKPAVKPAGDKPASTTPSLIPSAAMKVLQQAGTPRPLPKLPAPPNPKPRAERHPVAVDVVFKHEGKPIHAHTRDLSATGFFAVTSAQIEMGTTLECELRVPTPGELASKSFTVRAKAMRRDSTGVGFSLVEPPRTLLAAIAAYTGA